MKKIIFLIITVLIIMPLASANDKQEALKFFNNYINEANNYSDSITSMYAPNAKIIRQVVKPDGTTANAYTDTSTYVKQMKLAQAGAKLRKYKNTYRNIVATPVAGGYKVSAERQPTGETYWLKTYQVLKKQPNGKWIITEEMMQTKQQIFLRYAKD